MPDPQSDLALAVAKPLAVKLIDQLLKPVAALASLVTEPLLDTFTNRFAEYLSRQYEKHSYLPTIVFQVRKPLEDLYVPLTVAEDASLHRDEKAKRFRLDRFQPSFLPELKRVLLIDDAGMGKTTASRYLLVQATKNLATVPVFIELRHLTPERGIFEILLSELNPPESDDSTLKIEKKQLIRLLEKGLFTFFLDGYDEIISKHREAVTVELKSFIDSHPENRFLLTSRPEHALTSFPSFRVFKIAPLEKAEAYSLIRNYDNEGEKSHRLIERLDDPSFRNVHEFLKNPLLTTLLYRAYDYKNQIPLKKPVFYRQVFDALYEWHDLTKDGYSTRTKECGLDIDGFHKILRGLGFVSVLRGRVEADTDEILQWIREARTYAPELRFSESDFLEDAIKAVPILRREGNSILWAHKSLAEYFASQFVVQDSKQDQARICQHIVSSLEIRRFQNFLDLLYDTDVAVFGRYFTLPLIDAFRNETVRIRKAFPLLTQAAAERRAATTTRGLIAYYSDIYDTEKFRQQVKEDAIATAKAWQLHTETENLPADQILPQGVTVQFPEMSLAAGSVRTKESLKSLHFVTPMSVILEVLIEKKHQLALLSSFYPPSPNTAIVGKSRRQHVVIDTAPLAVWNSKKNFDRTTAAIMKQMTGVINPERVSAVVSEIEMTSRQSSTTSTLLDSLSRT